MNKQRKVLITITYNEMGIIIDTKAEEVAQPNLQPTCNELATDCISRQAAIGLLDKTLPEPYTEDPCNGCGYLGESCVGEGCGKLTERKDCEV